MESFSKNFSEALRRARGDRSQAEFARVLGLDHQATYARYEKDGRIPSGEVLYQMASRIGISMEELLLGYKPISESALRENAPAYGATIEEITKEFISLLVEEAKQPMPAIWRALHIVTTRRDVDESFKVRIARVVADQFDEAAKGPQTIFKGETIQGVGSDVADIARGAAPGAVAKALREHRERSPLNKAGGTNDDKAAPGNDTAKHPK